MPLGPLFLELPQSSLPSGTPQFPLLQSLLQPWFRSTVGQRVRSLLLVCWSLRLLSLSLSPGPHQQEPRVPVSVGPLGAARTITRTAMTFICIDSFINNVIIFSSFS